MQTYVEIPFEGLTLRGMKHVPENGSRCFPAVVFFHGFTGNRIESHRMFYALSRALEQAGIASVRFDFMGSGESDGDYADMTLPLLIQQGTSVLRWMQSELTPSECYVLGYSLGGLVGSLVTENNASVSKAAFISPGRARRILERDEALFAHSTDEVLDLNGNRVGKQYYLTLEPYQNQPTRFHAHQRILIIHGTADTATPIEYGKEYLVVPGGEKVFVEIQGADHGYSSLPWQTRLVQEVVQFFTRRSELSPSSRYPQM